jgi:hypothetical protein
MPAVIASVTRSSTSGVASLPPVTRPPPGGVAPAAIVEHHSGGTPGASATSAVSVPMRSGAEVTPPCASARSRSASPTPETIGERSDGVLDLPTSHHCVPLPSNQRAP